MSAHHPADAAGDASASGDVHLVRPSPTCPFGSRVPDCCPTGHGGPDESDMVELRHANSEKLPLALCISPSCRHVAGAARARARWCIVTHRYKTVPAIRGCYGRYITRYDTALNACTRVTTCGLAPDTRSLPHLGQLGKTTRAGGVRAPPASGWSRPFRFR